MDGGRPIVDKPERCTGCELCVWICPDFAIKVTKDGRPSRSLDEKQGES
jgi:NAD-dependent dihydropyrimidine dehydrogenase PreA subunit